MSKQITEFKLNVEFDNGFGGKIHMEDMHLDLDNIEEFLLALKEPLLKMAEYPVGKLMEGK